MLPSLPQRNARHNERNRWFFLTLKGYAFQSAQRNHDLTDPPILLHVAVCRGVFIQSDKDPIDLRRKAVRRQTIRNEALGTFNRLGPWRKAQLRVSRKIENPETGVHFEPAQDTRAKGKRCP